MHSSFSSDIVSALENLLTADYDRIRLRLWRKFGEQLRNIPDAPTPDDLLHDAIKDLLAERRHCPLERIELTICLVNIVRSKVSHLYKKWKQEGIVKVSDEALNTVQVVDVQDSELREKILALVADDPLLTGIVEYRLDHPEAKARAIAEALGMDMQEMYNANRRLKARLKSLVPPTESKHSQGELADVAAT